MKEKIVKILIDELDYSSHVAEVTAEDLLNLHPQLQPILQKWLDTRESSDLHTSGFSLLQLITERQYTFPSALIAMDWLLTDPKTAKTALSEDVMR